MITDSMEPSQIAPHATFKEMFGQVQPGTQFAQTAQMDSS
jgi:hypothetical protein